MRQKRSPSMRGSVMQNNVSVRMRAEGESGLSFMMRLGLLLGGFVILAAFLIWFWRSGHMHDQVERARDAIYDITQKSQFAVKDITVQGRHRAAKEDVYDALGTQRGAPIFAFDAEEAASRLSKITWIQSATVERILPDTISVTLVEREPAARWQHDDHLFVIDEDGHVLPSVAADTFPNLPLVVGTGASECAHDLLSLLKNYPDISQKMDSAVRVSERRWDLHMQPKIIVRLPEEDVNGALHRLSVLMTEEHILDRNVSSIDLRIPDRLVMDPVLSPKTPSPNHPGAHP